LTDLQGDTPETVHIRCTPVGRNSTIQRVQRLVVAAQETERSAKGYLQSRRFQRAAHSLQLAHSLTVICRSIGIRMAGYRLVSRPLQVHNGLLCAFRLRVVVG